MNLIRLQQCGNVNCLSQGKASLYDNHQTTFTRTVYQVDAKTICRIIERNEHHCLYKSFGQLLYLASTDRQGRKGSYQDNNALLLTNTPELIPVGIHWNPSQCTTSDVEDLVSIIDPFIYLRELFSNVTISKQLDLIGLICFYGGSIEVFFSYEHSTSRWHFCFDGNLTILPDWNAVQRKCLDFHLQPFLLIYVNSQQNPVDITQLLKQTVIQEKILPYERRLDPIAHSMKKQEPFQLNQNPLKQDLYSLENLSKISSFATLNSSMLFMPKPSSPTPSYINQETVVKVMQQQLLKKELLSDITSSSSLSPPSSLVHIRQRYKTRQKSDETLSSGDSSTSSQRDSGLSSGINDGSSDDSPRDSLAENEQIEIDSLTKQTEQMMGDNHLDMSLTSIEYHLEQSLKHESASDYSSALESCQRVLVHIDQMLNLSHNYNSRLLIYFRTRKNSLLLRIRSLRKRQIEHEELNPTPIKSPEKKMGDKITSILLSTEKLSRPKKNVKFSDHVALIVPTSDDTNDPPTEHLIHSFLRNIHQQQTTTSDSDSDTPSISSNDIPIGLTECSLCYKRFSKSNQIGTYCTNCHFYMQRFRPTNP